MKAWSLLLLILCLSFQALAKDQSKEVNGKWEDNIALPFVDDPAVLGRWVSVDFVPSPDKFQEGKRFNQVDLYLKELIFLKGGKTEHSPWTWTKGTLIHPGDKTAGKYEIKELNGKPIMFLEWKSGDYTLRHQKPEYYVLTKK